ncbi:MAG: hypothetical protein KFH87_10105 [Bacteroidetes bacterium]|nr:hypothetical protein [Bacteroidota bacterium]
MNEMPCARKSCKHHAKNEIIESAAYNHLFLDHLSQVDKNVETVRQVLSKALSFAGVTLRTGIPAQDFPSP